MKQFLLVVLLSAGMVGREVKFPQIEPGTVYRQSGDRVWVLGEWVAGQDGQYCHWDERHDGKVRHFLLDCASDVIATSGEIALVSRSFALCWERVCRLVGPNIAAPLIAADWLRVPIPAELQSPSSR